MKKKKKYLELYHKLMVDQKLPSENGLCNEGLRGDPLFELMKPHYSENEFAWWGYNGEMTGDQYYNLSATKKAEVRKEFTPLRQTIVLFMAALNEEL